MYDPSVLSHEKPGHQTKFHYEPDISLKGTDEKTKPEPEHICDASDQVRELV